MTLQEMYYSFIAMQFNWFYSYPASSDGGFGFGVGHKSSLIALELFYIDFYTDDWQFH